MADANYANERPSALLRFNPKERDHATSSRN